MHVEKYSQNPISKENNILQIHGMMWSVELLKEILESPLMNLIIRKIIYCYMYLKKYIYINILLEIKREF